MACDMHEDVELLNELLDKPPVVTDRVTGRSSIITAKLLAHWADRSIQTISDYRNSRTNIPTGFWHAILRRFLDLRIVHLLIPDDCEIELCLTNTPPPVNARAFFKEVIAEEAMHHEKQKYIAEMLADGRIDELDAATVASYNDAYHKHRLRDAMIRRAIVATFNRAVAYARDSA